MCVCVCGGGWGGVVIGSKDDLVVTQTFIYIKLNTFKIYRWPQLLGVIKIILIQRRASCELVKNIFLLFIHSFL